MAMQSRGYWVLVLFGLVAVGGCGPGVPKTTPVSGTVQWEDGKPISGATIRFVPSVPGGRDAAGITGKDGDFVLSTFGSGDGAVPGEYTAVLIKATETPVTAAPVGSSAEERDKAMKSYFDKAKQVKSRAVDPIPPAYQSEKTSPLKWRVEANDTKKPEFKVKKS